jgi:hypothetical protein
MRSTAAGAVIRLTILRHLRNSGGSISIGMWNGCFVFGMTTDKPSPPYWSNRADENRSSSRAASKRGL